MKSRRILSAILILAISLTLCVSSSFALENSTYRASPTLSEYNAIVTKGYSSGNIIITYDVEANDNSESVGVSSIKIYKSNGSYVTTITGTVENDLIGTNTPVHRSSYTYHGVSGTYYYAVLTVFATINGVTDSRTITTKSVQAP